MAYTVPAAGLISHRFTAQISHTDAGHRKGGHTHFSRRCVHRAGSGLVSKHTKHLDAPYLSRWFTRALT